MTEDYRTLVTRLRHERGMSLEDLAFTARAHAPRGSVSLSLIQKRLAPGSAAPPSSELLVALARALDVEPTVFAEYRLAAARRLFDEREVGLDQACANFSELRTALEQLMLATGDEVPLPSPSESRVDPGKSQPRRRGEG